jgi:PEP-CTERM motif
MQITWGSTARHVRQWLVSATMAIAALQSAHAYVLTVDPASQTTTLGSQIGITITVGDVLPMGLGAYNLDLSFEEAVLQFDRVVDGFGLGSNAFGLSYSLSGNVLSFADTSLDDVDTLLAQQSSSFALLTIYFDAIGVGTSGLSLSAITLADASAIEGLYTLSNGSVTVLDSVQPPIPEPSTWLLMLAGLGTVGWIARSQRRRENVISSQPPH